MKKSLMIKAALIWLKYSESNIVKYYYKYYYNLKQVIYILIYCKM